MKRTIKFRGKRLDNGEWLYGDLMHDNVDGCPTNVGTTAVLDATLLEKLKEIGSRPCDPSMSGLPTLEKDERGFQYGQLTYKE